MRLCARLEGMITDPVYEGKSMQGMIDLVQKGYFPAGSKVLYAHLGGVPAHQRLQLHFPQRIGSDCSDPALYRRLQAYNGIGQARYGKCSSKGLARRSKVRA